LRHRRRSLSIAAAIAAAALLITPGALASGTSAPVPHATYSGTASDGAAVTFTVSGDGSTITMFDVLGIFGTDKNGAQCQGTAAGLNVPITAGTFAYAQNTTFTFDGTFNGAQSASGTFDYDQVAYGSGAGCSTGTVTWSATTKSTSPGGGHGGGGGGGSGGGSKSPKDVPVRLSLRRASVRHIAGSVRASSGTCIARRTVYLWHGKRRISSVRSTKKGSFTFKDSKALRGKHLRATVTALSTDTVSCEAASSRSIKG
jgi:hypothetical protein